MDKKYIDLKNHIENYFLKVFYMSLGIKDFDLAKKYNNTPHTYSITINPDDSKLYADQLFETRLNNVLTEVSGLMFNNIRPYIKSYDLIPEIACDNHLSKISRIHYHGVILFISYEHYLRFRLNEYKPFSKHFNCEMKRVYTIEYWIDYIEKDQDILKPIYDNLDIPYYLSSSDLKYCRKKKEPPQLITIKKQFDNNCYSYDPTILP